MTMTYNSALNKMAERVADRTIENRQDQLQRRNQVVDMYGMEFTRQGDSEHPAAFYISVSPDIIYYERFEFKIIIQPFAMPIGGGGATGMATSQINGTNLSINQNNQIAPNPHSHTSAPHNHSLDAGITMFSSHVSDFEIWVAGYDITPYMKTFYNNEWVNGEGIFPTNGLRNYDLLKVSGIMPDWLKGTVLAPGYKKIELKGKGVFSATLVNYLKYSHVNR
ncbi:hypothetical protein [uncultured Enterococcus sp.]|uniref:hypothetical protein n=1 Tax=uncultured Enterococcus sp. TaxID=167972 RepID=UPI002AA7BCB1|nr:hypothetical protein [uncultured Enterococcus sp.]